MDAASPRRGRPKRPTPPTVESGPSAADLLSPVPPPAILDPAPLSLRPLPPGLPIPPEEARPLQRAVHEMASGCPMSEAAARSGMDRQRLATLLRESAPLRRELDLRSAELAEAAARRVLRVQDRAVQVLEELLEDESPKIRHQAARDLLALGHRIKQEVLAKLGGGGSLLIEAPKPERGGLATEGADQGGALEL